MDQGAHHRLTIGRLDCTYLVPHDHSAPERVRADLDDIARRYARECCERALSAQMDEKDPSVWLIDKVHVDVLMDLSAAPADEVGAFWATQMASSVIKTIAQGDDGSHVMHFASRAEYLAWFLRELAADRAWSHWYFDQFASLRSLPKAAAMREALLREPHLAEPVLLHLLRTNALQEVIPVLSAMDRERLLTVCAPREEAPEEACLEAALGIWRSGACSGMSALELYLRLRDQSSEFLVAEVRGAAQAVFIVEQWARRSRLNEVLSAISGNSIARILPSMAPDETRTALLLLALLRDKPEWVGKIAVSAGAQAGPSAIARAVQDIGTSETHFPSAFGGVFLLLPVLLDDRRLLATFGGMDDAWLRYQLLRACFGPFAKDASLDRAVLLAAGLDDAPSAQPGARVNLVREELDLLPGDIEYIAVAEVDPPLSEELKQSAAALMRGLARRLPGLGKSSFGYLWSNVLNGGASVTVSNGKIVVDFAPRPLQIVLRMAGYKDLNLTPPWHGETEILLRFTEP
jgi:hypothetical protein